MLVLFTIFGICGAIPEPYYENVTWVDHSEDGLKAVLGLGLTEPYVFGVFDCSERSAYVDWVLKNHGFDTKICANWKGIWAPEGHSWVQVKLDHKVIYVEVCDPSGYFVYIDFFNDKWSEYNRKNDDAELSIGMHRFNDIYDAIEQGMQENELDWWTVIKKN